jgi:hypothetical protein
LIGRHKPSVTKLANSSFPELRERARKELGAKFDIRTFHDEMLSGGNMPLDLLETRTESWIALNYRHHFDRCCARKSKAVASDTALAFLDRHVYGSGVRKPGPELLPSKP